MADGKTEKRRVLLTPPGMVLLFLSFNLLALLGYAGFLTVTGKLNLEKLRMIADIVYDIEREQAELISSEEDLIRKVAVYAEIENRREEIHENRLLEQKESEKKLAGAVAQINKYKKEVAEIQSDIAKRDAVFAKQVTEREELQKDKGFKKTVRFLQEMEAVSAAEHLFSKGTDGSDDFSDDMLIEILLAIPEAGFVAEIVNAFRDGDGTDDEDSFKGDGARATRILELLMKGGRKLDGTAGPGV